jgi:hypothetical protein
MKLHVNTQVFSITQRLFQWSSHEQLATHMEAAMTLLS